MDIKSKYEVKARIKISKARDKYFKTGKEQLVKIKMSEYFYIDAIEYLNAKRYEYCEKIEYSIITKKNNKYIKIWYNYDSMSNQNNESDQFKRFGIDPVNPDDVEW